MNINQGQYKMASEYVELTKIQNKCYISILTTWRLNHANNFFFRQITLHSEMASRIRQGGTVTTVTGIYNATSIGERCFLDIAVNPKTPNQIDVDCLIFSDHTKGQLAEPIQNINRDYRVNASELISWIIEPPLCHYLNLI